MRYRWILMVLLLAGCGGGGGGNEGNAPPPVARFAFVANLGSVAGGGELSAYTVNTATGQLRQVLDDADHDMYSFKKRRTAHEA